MCVCGGGGGEEEKGEVMRHRDISIVNRKWHGETGVRRMVSFFFFCFFFFFWGGGGRGYEVLVFPT